MKLTSALALLRVTLSMTSGDAEALYYTEKTSLINIVMCSVLMIMIVASFVLLFLFLSSESVLLFEMGTTWMIMISILILTFIIFEHGHWSFLVLLVYLFSLYLC